MASCCSVRGRASRLLEAFVNQSLLNKVSRNISHVSGRYLVTEAKQGRLYPQLACELWAASPWRCGCRRGLTLGMAQHQLHQTGRQPEPASQSHKLWEDDLKGMVSDIQKELKSNHELREIARYYFDGQGKAVRPMITVLMARAVNAHVHSQQRLLEEQRQVAMIAEMIHTASLVHDDVIDGSDTRRGKPSVNFHYGQRKAIMAGDYILSVAATKLARLRNEEVVVVLSQVLADLVQGEFMQLGSKENENERFAHYLRKTFKKTASLIAYSCKAVAILSGADESIQEVAFQYGRNVGIAFQLVDDLLDFVASSKILGKPTTIDLKLGLATAPVLFACEKFPELNPMIMRRFQEPGDVQKAFEYVHKSDGLEQTQFLAEQHCQEAIKVISSLESSMEQKSLVALTDKIINRTK